jgi:two-component system, chemotaxis family, chemotaxis protein CheY
LVRYLLVIFIDIDIGGLTFLVLFLEHEFMAEFQDDLDINLSEIVELIEQIELDLLMYEDLLDAPQDTAELVHRIFRAAHNLKSSFGLIHRNASSLLVHAVESNFDLIRNGMMKPTQTLVHQSLLAVDAMRFNIFLPEERTEDLERIREELDSIFHAGREAASKESVALQFVLTERQKILLRSMIAQNFNVFQIEKTISPHSFSQTSYENLPIYDDIREVGIHIATYPEYEALPKNVPEALVRIIIATTFTADDLGLHIFDPLKPVDAASIDVGSQKAALQAAAQTPKLRTARAVRPLNILVAEDDFVSRTVIHEILSPFGVCDLAADGREALIAFEQTLKEGGRYDLVCLDIMMPGMDGIQALDGVRSLEQQHEIMGHERVKVVMTTALDSLDQVFKAFRLQCDAYLIKPMTRAKILNQLRKLHLIES